MHSTASFYWRHFFILLSCRFLLLLHHVKIIHLTCWLNSKCCILLKWTHYYLWLVCIWRKMHLILLSQICFIYRTWLRCLTHHFHSNSLQDFPSLRSMKRSNVARYTNNTYHAQTRGCFGWCCLKHINQSSRVLINTKNS